VGSDATTPTISVQQVMMVIAGHITGFDYDKDRAAFASGPAHHRK